MNLTHMKYAVEIAEARSINKAAEKLYVGQPNLSRALKELETSLGITIFERSAKGMTLTPDGEIFIRYAKTILKQIDDVESIFKSDNETKSRFAISVPRASYITEAFTQFSKSFGKNEQVELFYRETNSMRTIKNVLQDDYKLGIIRYAENFDHYYKNMMSEKNFSYELISEFRYVILTSKDSPLAKLEKVTYEDLADYIEVAHADPYVPSLSFAEVKKEELPDNSTRRILLFERASQFEILSQNTETFMWVSPIPQTLLNRYGLVERICDENQKIYKDVLIYRKDYTLSSLDNRFIKYLNEAKREIIDKGVKG
ncbi:MAG: LysR family transcriptional regulator [Ruminococcus sp.]